ncbi:MAG: hypothetical protein AAFV95_23665 [Bacteroidota bacterium]
MMTQEQIKQLIVPLIRQKGRIYRKAKRIFAKVAKGGEIIYTVTSDGLESQNVASRGDFIVRNQTQAREKYVVDKEIFENRYQLIKSSPQGYNEYQSIGKVMALAVDDDLMGRMGMGNEFFFIARWGEKMIVKEHDFIACPPDFSEVYRIARKEFFETYIPDASK